MNKAYEKGGEDATQAILEEYRKFKQGKEGRSFIMFDEADIREAGLNNSEESKRDK